VAMKANCWEVKKCGREPGGARMAELGACPAPRANFSGWNHGTGGGRICWAVAGTLCGGKIQGTFAQKAVNCMACEFYQAVRREEGSAFKLKPPN
jgi:hypothetical protein